MTDINGSEHTFVFVSVSAAAFFPGGRNDELDAINMMRMRADPVRSSFRCHYIFERSLSNLQRPGDQYAGLASHPTPDKRAGKIYATNFATRTT